MDKYYFPKGFDPRAKPPVRKPRKPFPRWVAPVFVMFIPAIIASMIAASVALIKYAVPKANPPVIHAEDERLRGEFSGETVCFNKDGSMSRTFISELFDTVTMTMIDTEKYLPYVLRRSASLGRVERRAEDGRPVQ